MSEETPDGTKKRGPLRRTLDACVFAPVGMALTLAEDIPDFVDKGKRRVQLELGNAMVVGRFVVAKGQHQISHRIDEVLHGLNDDEQGHDDGGRPVSDRAPSPQPPLDPAASAIVESALADYDTLSASQVVRRLESLGPEELLAVQRYEASTRNRRTILNRASQLLDEGPAAANE